MKKLSLDQMAEVKGGGCTDAAVGAALVVIGFFGNPYAVAAGAGLLWYSKGSCSDIW